MSLSIITHLSTDSYRLKTLELMVKSLAAQAVKDFELVIVNHDSEDRTQIIKEHVGEQDFPVLLHYFPRETGYQVNDARNVGHHIARRTWHLIVDCDLVFPPNFVESIYNHLSNEEYPGHVLDVFTFLHCSTLGQSNSKTSKARWGATPYFVTEEDLDKICLPDVFEKAQQFLIRMQKAVPGHAHRSMTEFAHYPCRKDCTIDELSYYWGHPVVKVEYNYKPNEMFFVAHKDFMKAAGYWPTTKALQNRGPDKIVMAHILYYLRDRAICSLHTITDTFLVHLEHPRPYEMKNHPGSEAISKTVKSHRFMKPIVNKVNDLWLDEKEKWDTKKKEKRGNLQK